MKTLLGTVVIFSAALAAFAETILISPSADTTLFQDLPDNNLGGILTVAAGTTAHGFFTRALMKFDVAGQIPPDAVVSSARLRLTVVRAPLGPQPSTFLLRRVLQDWGEGNKASFDTLGDLATDGEATWRSRFHPGAGWSVPGGAAGADFSATTSSSAPSADTNTIQFNTSPQMVADVQHWLVNPNQNFGWMVMSGSESVFSSARRFASHEDSANAPILEVEFAPPFHIDNATLVNGRIRFSFAVEPQFTYTVESRASLGTGSWSPLTNFTERASSYDALISDPIAGPSRFYRALKAPCNCQ